MRKYYVHMLVFLALLAMGCATGGGDVESEYTTGESGMTVTDESGFEKNIGPAEISYRSALQFLAAGNYMEAITQLKSAVGIKPAYLEAWSELGKTYTKLKSYEDGIAAFERALELSPDNEALIESDSIDPTAPSGPVPGRTAARRDR